MAVSNHKIERTIGLMSGTSTDGVDGVVLAFEGGRQRIEAFASLGFSAALREEMLALNRPGDNELHRAALAANALAGVYAAVVRQLLDQTGLQPHQISAIGAHGQTVRHRPGEFDGIGYTLQLNQPALLAELTGIRVIADFRSRDVAAGGQGAPLVPAYHDAVFADEVHPVVLLNLGGIGNISVLPPLQGNGTVERRIVGFDCGPGNALLDAWCCHHTGQDFDDNGAWGANGLANPALLAKFLEEPYFCKPAPKSTGRDLFNWSWLGNKLQGFERVQPVDVQATLVALTVQAAASAIAAHGAGAEQVLVCGGGALNGDLMRHLALALPNQQVASTALRGIDALHVEAAAFAWLAQCHCKGETANLPNVTGARHARVLGASYPP
jgi:anhydro-N-acetylmuramic acid kinase